MLFALFATKTVCVRIGLSRARLLLSIIGMVSVFMVKEGGVDNGTAAVVSL